jgi:hypothetical protein
MNNRIHGGLWAVAAAAALWAGPVNAQDLPDGRAVLERYQEAVGGRDVLARFNSMHAKGEFSMPAQGLVAPVELVSARPNRAAMRVTIAGFGELSNGHTGEVAWSLNPMEGPRLMEGAEKTQAEESARFDSALRLSSIITAAESVERTKLAGRDCLKVRLTWQSGRQTYDCYSEETGLLVGTIGTQQSPMGSVEVLTLMEDYREFEGFRMPTRMTMQIMGLDQVITLREVSFDSVPDSAFELPAEVRGLIRQ